MIQLNNYKLKSEKMKTLKKVILVLAFVSTAFAVQPISAQQATPQTVDNRNYNDDDNDRGVSPWWGLLGLIGLFGLMRRTDRHHMEANARNPR